MQTSSSSLGRKHGWLGFVLAYLLAGVTSLIGLAVWFVQREFLLTLLRRSSLSSWTWGLIDKLGIVLFGLLWLVVTLLSQHYYEKALAHGRIWGTFGRVTAVELAIGVLLLAGWLILGGGLSFLLQ